MEEVRFTGHIRNIIYQNPTNGYAVLILDNGKEELTVTGSFFDISPGEKITVTGNYEEHKSYGLQLRMSSFEIEALDDTDDVERYLGSGAIKGIGVKLAARIIKQFKEDTIRIIEEEPERLAEVKGISMAKAQEIGIQVLEKRAGRRVMSFLIKNGISDKLSVKIYEKYGEDAIELIKTNPYRLAEDIEGIGFKKADEIASANGILINSEYRIKSGIIYALTQALYEGNTCLPKEDLIARSIELLGLDEDDIDEGITNLMAEHHVIIRVEEDGHFVFGNPAYKSENACAEKLIRLKLAFSEGAEERERRLKLIESVEKEMGIRLDDLQKEAVFTAAGNGVSIITGGPGTGKTTAINAILGVLEAEGARVLLAAPTGRAAKRMTETCKREASTIHRLLEIGITDDRSIAYFGRDEENPIDADALIIDETSMVDTFLLNALLSAVSEGMRVIFIGDADQLPSVGPGNVLKDMIESGVIPVIRFNKVFRQTGDSDILSNAHRIISGEPLVIDNKNSKDFYFVKREEAEKLREDIVYLVKKSLPEHLKTDSSEIQVLTPMRKGVFGSVNLNSILQERLNPPDKSKKEWEYGDTIFREGDKVMQVKNDYDIDWEIRGNYGLVSEKGKGIFNGDIGRITDINEYAGLMEIKFDDDRVAFYSREMLEELELSYAITIHKSQGSEYEAVVMPLFAVTPNMRYRNLLYTGVTRARQCVTILGSEMILNDMIRENDKNLRYSGLRKRLIERSHIYEDNA